MKFPRELIPYLRLQRTGWKDTPEDVIVACHVEEMRKEFEEIQPFLPDRCESALDIGCGVATFDMFLYQYCGCDIHLLDKDQQDPKIHYGYEKEGSFYNSLSGAAANLVENGIPVTKVFTMDPDKGLPPIRYDLVVSLLSWGYHYPVSMYVEYVVNQLNEGGVIILDIRKDTEGAFEIGTIFEHAAIPFEVVTIKNTSKYSRVWIGRT